MNETAIFSFICEAQERGAGARKETEETRREEKKEEEGKNRMKMENKRTLSQIDTFAFIVRLLFRQHVRATAKKQKEASGGRLLP